MQWVGYPEKTWVPENLCNCDDLIRDFEISSLNGIIGAGKAANIVTYAVNVHSNVNFELALTNEMLEKWPQQLIDFLESRIEFDIPDPSPSSIDNVEFNVNIVAAGKPTSILGE